MRVTRKWTGYPSCESSWGSHSTPATPLLTVHTPTDSFGRARSPVHSKFPGVSQLNFSSSCQSEQLARLRHRIRSSHSSQGYLDDGLCMNIERSRKNRQSLSSIGNQPTQGATDLSDGIHTSLIEAERERLAWDIINREVSEWQNVCQTGRPSWWLPTSKYRDSGIRYLNPAQFPLVPLAALPGPNHDRLLKLAHCGHRRSVTEGCLTTNDDVQDLVQLIALQLLGACFTLPDEYIANFDQSKMILDDAVTSYGLPDPKLISSLKMHTYRRYSPSFGHDATNTSPTLFWDAGFNALSPSSSPGQSSNLQKPKDKVCVEHARRRRVYRPLQVSENSAAGSQSSMSEAEEKCDEGWQRQHFSKRSKVRFNLFDIPNKNLALRSQTTEAVGHSHFQDAPSSSLGERGNGNEDSNIARGNFTPRYSSRYVLRPTIRSEPHPVFIQPVKELVVKKWHNICRRFGQSQARGCPDPSGTSAGFASQNSFRSVSPGSPQMLSGGKQRRREARERHDINSDVGDSPRDGSLALSTETEAESTEYAAGIPRPPSFRHVDSLSLICGFKPSIADSAEMVTNSAEQTAPEGPSFQKSLGVNLGSRTESGFFSTVVKAKQQQTSPLFRPRRQSARCQRKSMLSEMCTADDDNDLNLAATPAGAILAATNEVPGTEDVVERSVLISQATPQLTQRTSSMKPMGSSPDINGFHGLAPAPSGRPRIGRTSTSGTQVFTPSENGVEVDGVPMGPGGGIWDEVNQENGFCKARERTYL